MQATNITERKIAEFELQKTQEELSEVTERIQLSTKASKVGIWDYQIKDNTLFWDDIMYALYGFEDERPEVSIAAWMNCVHPDDVIKENEKY